MNSIGDACDPAGPCGGTFSGQTARLINMRRDLPVPCLYLELEGTNLRFQSDTQGSFNARLPYVNGQRRILGFHGRGTSDTQGSCLELDSPHSSIYQSTPFFAESLTFSQDNQDEEIVRDLFIAPKGVLRGRVLKANEYPNHAVHHGIRGRALGASRRATLTDPRGYFTFEGLQPDTDYTLIISEEGYETQHIEDITVVEGEVTILNADALINRSTPPSLEASQGRCQPSLMWDSCSEYEGGGPVVIYVEVRAISPHYVP